MKKRYLGITVFAVIFFAFAFFMASGASVHADETDVAQIGEVGYDDLETAIEAAEAGDTIKLVNDIVSTEEATLLYSTKYYYLYSISKDITLDMNGYTISWDMGTSAGATINTAGYYSLFYVSGTLLTGADSSQTTTTKALTTVTFNAADFTITDSSTDKDGSIIVRPVDDYTGAIYRISAVTFDKWIVNSETGTAATYAYNNGASTSTYAIVTGASLTVEDVTIKVEAGTATGIIGLDAITYFSASGTNPTVTLDDATLKVNSEGNLAATKSTYGVFLSASYGKVVIKNDSIIEVSGAAATALASIYGVNAYTIEMTSGVIGVKYLGDALNVIMTIRAASSNAGGNSFISGGYIYRDLGNGTTGSISDVLGSVEVRPGAKANITIVSFGKEGIVEHSDGADIVSVFGTDQTFAYYYEANTENVAINTTTNENYLTLTEAIAEASSGETIQLLNDVYLRSDPLNITTPITLDLNGYEIYSGLLGSNSSNNGIVITLASIEEIVTITDSQATSSSDVGAINGTIQVAVGDVTIEKIIINGNTCQALAMTGTNIAAKLTVKGVTINVDQSNAAASFVSKAILTTSTGIVVFEDYSTSFPMVANISSDGTGIVALSNSSAIANITINSGTYNLTSTINKETEIYYNQNNVSGKVYINGGTFTLTSSIKYMHRVNYGTLYVTAGTFNIDPNACVVTGYRGVLDEVSGTYTVSVAPVAKIGDTEYMTLQAALEAANENDEIVLQYSFQTSSTVVFDKNVTISGDYTVATNATPAIIVNNGITCPISISDYQAKITDSSNNTKYYNTLQTALSNASTGDTVVLLSNAGNVTIPAKTLTVDLNGYTITKLNGFGSNLSTIVTTLKNGTVGSATQNYGIETAYYFSQSVKQTIILDEDLVVYGINVEGDNTITIKSGATLKAGSEGYGLFTENTSSAIVNVYGTIDDNEVALINNGLATGNSIINIYDGAEIDSDILGIYHPGKGEVNIYGGTITANSSAIEIRSGSLNISGGRLTATATTFETSNSTNGSTTSGAAVVVTSYDFDDLDVTISGGTFNGLKAIYANDQRENPLSYTYDITINITDGTFNGAIYAADSVYIDISGGSYNTEFEDDYLAIGYVLVENTGIYTLSTTAVTVAYKAAANGSDDFLSNLIAVKVNGSDMTTGQTIYSADEITIIASQYAGHNFMGWYYYDESITDYSEETPLSSTATFTFVMPTTGGSVIAIYYPLARVSLSITGTKFAVTVADATFNNQFDEYIDNYVMLNTTITVVADSSLSSVFKYWKSESGKILSTNMSYTFEISSGTNVIMVCSTVSEGFAKIEFLSPFSQVLKVVTVEKSSLTDEILATYFPVVAPSKMGYTFTGWDLDADDIKDSDENFITLTPTFTKDQTPANIEIYVNTYLNAALVSDDILIGEAFTVTAPEVEGKTFNYWTNEAGQVLSYNTSLTTTAIAVGMKLYAVYSANAVVGQPVVNITNITAANSKISFVSSSSAPEGYIIQNWGIMYTTSVLTNDTFILGESSISTIEALNTSASTFTLNVSVGSSVNTEVYTRAYIVLEDESGNQTTVYSNIAHANYNDLLD